MMLFNDPTEWFHNASLFLNAHISGIWPPIEEQIQFGLMFAAEYQKSWKLPGMC